MDPQTKENLYNELIEILSIESYDEYNNGVEEVLTSVFNFFPSELLDGYAKYLRDEYEPQG